MLVEVLTPLGAALRDDQARFDIFSISMEVYMYGVNGVGDLFLAPCLHVE